MTNISSLLVPLVLGVILIGCGLEERYQMIVKLEAEAERHNVRTDSLIVEANAFTERIQQLGVESDSIQTANRKLMASMLEVKDATLEYHQSLIRQKLQVGKLQNEIEVLKADPNRSDTKLQLLRVEVETLNATLKNQYQNIIRLETDIKQRL